jgi:hypothetical protein
MNLVLKRFSQDVDLRDPESVQYFLVFQKDDDDEVRLPVQKETTEALVRILYSGGVEKVAEVEGDDRYDENSLRKAEPEDFSEATEFGGSEEEEFTEPKEEESSDDMPASEDEVPSL